MLQSRMVGPDQSTRCHGAVSILCPRHDEPSPVPDEQDPPPSDVDLAEEFVDLARYELGVRANATVVKVADRTLGTLLDVFDERRA